jgi:hypothetical protein
MCLGLVVLLMTMTKLIKPFNPSIMFRNPNTPALVKQIVTKHHQMCAMRFKQLPKSVREKGYKVGGYWFRQMSADSAYLVPSGTQASWDSVLFFSV